MEPKFHKSDHQAFQIPDFESKFQNFSSTSFTSLRHNKRGYQEYIETMHVSAGYKVNNG